MSKNAVVPVPQNYAIVVLDETGSMDGQEGRVVESMNGYVKTLPDGCHLSVFKFDSAHWTEHFAAAKEDWNTMTEADYNPGQMTPLYDAIARGIRHGEKLAKDGDRVLVMIDTDGHENASKEQTQASIKSMVDRKKTDGWEFLFVAGGIDQAATASVGTTGAKLGMATQNVMYSARTAAYSAGGSTASFSSDYFETGKVDGIPSDGSGTDQNDSWGAKGWGGAGNIKNAKDYGGVSTGSGDIWDQQAQVDPTVAAKEVTKTKSGKRRPFYE